MSTAMDLHKPLRQAFLDEMRDLRIEQMEQTQRLQSQSARVSGTRADMVQELVLDQFTLLAICNRLHDAGYRLVKED